MRHNQGRNPLNDSPETVQTDRASSLALLLTALVLSGKRIADALIDKHTVDDSVTFFNLRLVIRLVAIALICLILLSAISQTWYTVPVALGIFSVLTGFALQSPMTSFVGWIFILSRRPYRVGDRIKIAGVTGDVIDISYFDTTLWEFGGQYLSTDHPAVGSSNFRTRSS